MDDPPDSECSEFVEIDPTGRYGRYSEILGRGASKIVYRAFDEYEGIEVAWNQVKVHDFLKSAEGLERLYSEIHILKALKHKNIMKLYASWIDVTNRNINFVTEMFTSGTLRQYRLKHKRVNIRAVKHWCRQILRGLLYLHNQTPPVIHRDLKCDNIFVNGNQGEVKIGDLGLAEILQKSHAVHCVGTPEFMAPEVYAEAYTELVDIYSFGMCILEMVTSEYPYSECSNPAQIYKKVTSGKKPEALYKVKDLEVRQFVEKCLANVADRLSAKQLLDDPFLMLDDSDSDSRTLDFDVFNSHGSLISQPLSELENMMYPYVNGSLYEFDLGHEIKSGGIDLFEKNSDDCSPNSEISIRGKRREDGSIFLRLRTVDKEGQVRNIYFPFEIENDTALSVATEMVAELDMMDQDVFKIADMIDGEIASLVPGWQIGEPPSDDDEIRENDDMPEQDVDEEEENAAAAAAAAIDSQFFECFVEEEEAANGAKEPPPCCECYSERKPQDTQESDVQQRLRWLRALYQMELRKLREQQLGDSGGFRGRFREVRPDGDGVKDASSQLSSNSLHRTASLPVDAVDL